MPNLHLSLKLKIKMGFILVISLSFIFFTSHGFSGLDPTRVTQLSWQPRVFLYKGFLSDQECDHIISLAEGKLEKSSVGFVASQGKSFVSKVRTSSGMFLNRHHDEIVTRIEQRISAWTFLPEENGETIQVLRYEIGQKYEPHLDYYTDKFYLSLGGHRVATMLMYLSNVEKGGETVFRRAKGPPAQHKNESWSECANHGYAVKPEKGDALLFFNLHTNMTTDPRSLHQSCPVISGEKWSATKWIHVVPFGRHFTGCMDENPLCPQWASLGECHKYPAYMVGSKDSPGFCRNSCGVCDS